MNQKCRKKKKRSEQTETSPLLSDEEKSIIVWCVQVHTPILGLEATYLKGQPSHVWAPTVTHRYCLLTLIQPDGTAIRHNRRESIIQITNSWLQLEMSYRKIQISHGSFALALTTSASRMKQAIVNTFSPQSFANICTYNYEIL